MSDRDKHDINQNKQPGKTYVSPRFEDGGGAARKASKVFDSTVGYEFDVEKGRLVLRESDGGRHVVDVRFFEADRQIKGITIQKYTSSTGRYHPSASLSFWGEQIPRLIEFLLNVKRIHFPNSDKINITDSQLRQMLLSRDQLELLAVEDQEALISLAHGKITKRDVVALAYRREQLLEFQRMLSDEVYFSGLAKSSREAAWQSFFERNHWIFGYGLTHTSLSALDGRRLQQIVAGPSIASIGKRPDALMKTRGVVNALCFAEIKTHQTPLLQTDAYRSGAWQPSSELTGGIVQSHATVHAALRQIGDRLDVSSAGDPTGEQIYNFDPRSYLVIGRLSEFMSDNGLNEPKYRSFEYFRRSVRRPEIITFDELYERAALIVAEHDLP